MLALRSVATRDFSIRPLIVSTASAAGCSDADPNAAAASIVNSPTSIARRLSTIFSASDSSSKLQSSVARKVWCRGSAVRRPFVRREKQSLSRDANPSTPKRSTRAAASSIASGIPSRRRQISITVATFPLLSSNESSDAAARSAKSSTAENPRASAIDSLSAPGGTASAAR